MKSTGMVRRIDDLGRVVIPKEIRRQAKIREGDPLEIFIDRDGEIILKKYSPIETINDFAKEYADAIYESTGHIVLIADTDQIIAVSGVSKVKFMNKSIDEFGDITNHKSIFENNKVFMPIVCEGSIVGAVILLANEDYRGKFDNLEFKIAETAAGFLAKQLEG
jgi:AbrB family transcriptional regulator (stage V sporulation protein T)